MLTTSKVKEASPSTFFEVVRTHNAQKPQKSEIQTAQDLECKLASTNALIDVGHKADYLNGFLTHSNIIADSAQVHFI